MAGTISAPPCAPRGHGGHHCSASYPADVLPAGRRLPADYLLAVQILLDEYESFFTAAELEELRLLSLQPELPPLKRTRVSVLGSIALTRSGEVQHGD